MMVMAEAAVWDSLTRLEQRALIKLFGGGTLRNNDPEVVDRLRAAGFVDENDGLAMPGLFVLTLAMRRQQAYERSRTGVTLAADHLLPGGPSASPQSTQRPGQEFGA